MAVPHLGQVFFMQGTAVSCASRCPQFGQRQIASEAAPDGTAHSPHTPAAAAAPLPPAAAQTHSAASSSSVHDMFLLFQNAQAPATAATAPPAAWHGEVFAFETSPEPGLDDLAQIAGHERDHPDPVRGDDGVQRPGDRPAHQRFDAELGQAKRLPDRHVIRQGFLPFGDDPSGFDLGDMDAPRGVEDRRDPTVPVREGRFHRPASCLSFTAG